MTYKVGDVGRWKEYDLGYRFVIKDVTETYYVYDIFKDNVLTHSNYTCLKKTVEPDTRKLTKLERALK